MTNNLYQRLLLGISCLTCAGMVMAQSAQLKPSASLSVPNSNQAAGQVIQADYIVAIVNSEPVTNNEIRSRLIRYERRLADQNQGMPPRDVLLKEILEDVIKEKIQLQLAKEAGIKIDGRILDAAAQNYADKNNIPIEELRKRVSSDGIGYAQIRTDLERQLIIQKLREREISTRVNIPENEIDAFLKLTPGVLSDAPPEIDLAQILIIVPEDANAAKIQNLKERAERLLVKAKSGEDFFKLAQENSDGTDAKNGGQMGMRPVDRYPTLFAEAVANLKDGDISDIIKSGAGFHILKVISKQSAGNAGLIVTQTRARHILIRPNAQMDQAAVIAKLVDFKKRIESKSTNFETIAKQNSQDGSASDGGQLGWSFPLQYAPEFENAMNRLAPGVISERTVTRFGVHLILVEERRDAKVALSELREQARNVLREKKLDENFNIWLNELRKNAYVEFREAPSK